MELEGDRNFFLAISLMENGSREEGEIAFSNRELAFTEGVTWLSRSDLFKNVKI